MRIDSSSRSDGMILGRRFNANGIKFSVSEREALECGGRSAALQRLPPIFDA